MDRAVLLLVGMTATEFFFVSSIIAFVIIADLLVIFSLSCYYLDGRSGYQCCSHARRLIADLLQAEKHTQRIAVAG